ncbi:M81 family metallopeptidase [Emcibacter nanhaiensis]|uniref:Microcystinase C n=1 Tax=Emcibacter nanhaiensis TaxID=1505037 RepID=A0A501PFT5_9PROT|nr:M81 family metallopeptidase [Emcibacter nanhaiensis]TPD59290.1 M81 family metallopeptidase [Emcibacter nanhaiensis]
MKVYCASMAHESNSFSPLPTNMDNFREMFLYRPSTGEGQGLLDSLPLEGILRNHCLEQGWEVIDGLYTSACPSAPCKQADYEALRDEMVDGLRKAMPVDMVLLFLHGAQMAEGYEDCEGDILKALREVAGPDIPIGVELDLHCNITPAMTENAAILMACKEYPHTDFDARAAELVALTEAAAKKTISPVVHYERVPMLGYFHTTREPMRSLVDQLFREEQRDGVLSVSLAHGFPAGDFPGVGAGVLVVTDNDPALAGSVAKSLAEKFFALRHDIAAPCLGVQESLDQAMAIDGGPVVIADASDNPGGGAAGDSTHFLRAILEAGIPDTAIGMIWDPLAYDLIEKAGEGTVLPLRIGGKAGPLSGSPVDGIAEVIRIRDDLQQLTFGDFEPLGPAAAIRMNNVEIIVNRVRQQIFGPRTFQEMGIDLSSKKIVVVKSAQHFHTQFSPIAAEVLYASPPGSVSTDFRDYPYRYIQRPIWPLDETPFTAYGKNWS